MFVASSNGVFFDNARAGDMVMRTQRPSDSILIGTRSNSDAVVTVGETSVMFSARSLLLSSDSVSASTTMVARVVDGHDDEAARAIYADSAPPMPSMDPDFPGWLYPGDAAAAAAARMAWYVLSNTRPLNAAMSAARMRTLYVRARVRGVGAALCVYTHPLGNGSDAASWFGSKTVYPLPEFEPGGDGVVYYVGTDPRDAGFLSLPPYATYVELRPQTPPEPGLPSHVVQLVSVSSEGAGVTLLESGYRFGEGVVGRLLTVM